ncbi:hypothetical protein EV192_107371 [Actinocrispum wychmicini]|uniref:Uncharacterized protein n=1 Tax=Actinocrispum wychmicini TaxID=1213861 RepID=A0A4R2JGB3_9PSEU|nr:hypothetical protein EV192_107371 [Actinocrispum wychmicini]
MTDMRKRGTRRQYLAAAFGVVCSSNADSRKPLSCQEQEILSGEGSSP